MRTPGRAEVYFVDLGGSLGRKPFVIVSNNIRNRQLTTVLGVRITTTNRNTQISTIVPLGRDCGDLAGWALCDEIEQLWRDELAAPGGVVGPATMVKIAAGLRIALSL